jgi:outer membrane protein TolC
VKRTFLLLLIFIIGKNYSQENLVTQNYLPDGLSSQSVQITNAKTHITKSAIEELNLSLNDAVTLALEQNKDVLLSNKDLEKAEAQINEAYGNAFPTLNFSAQYSRNILSPVLFIPANNALFKNPDPLKISMSTNNSYSAGLSLSQILFSAKVNTAIKIAKEYSNYTDQNAKTVREDIVLNVKKTYYGVLLTQRVVEATRQGLELAKATYDKLNKLYKEGMASEFDLLRAEVQVANTEPALSQAESQVVLAKNALKNLLGLNLEQDISLISKLEFEELPLNVVEEESQLSLGRNSTLLGLHAYEQILDKNIDIQKADNYPTLAAFGNYQYQAQDNGLKFNKYNSYPVFIVGLSLTYNIFNGLQTKYRTEQAVIEKDKIVLTSKKLEEGIKIQVDETKLRMIEAKKRVDAQARSVEQATKAGSIADVRFKNGLGTQLELIDAQVALTRTQINKAQATYDYLIARADWERASGYNKL